MDSQEYTLISQQLGAMTTLMNAQFGNVHERLDKINGKVAHHEEQITEALIERAKNREEQRNAQNVHIINCPNTKRVDDLMTDKKISISKKQLIMTALAVLVSVVAISSGVMRINSDLRTKEYDTIIARDSIMIKNQLQLILNQAEFKQQASDNQKINTDNFKTK